jgi:hypothetical protein
MVACRFFKTPDGVKVQELSAGSGRESKAGDRITVDYVLRCSLQLHAVGLQHCQWGHAVADGWCMQTKQWLLHLFECGGGQLPAPGRAHRAPADQPGKFALPHFPGRQGAAPTPLDVCACMHSVRRGLARSSLA